MAGGSNPALAVVPGGGGRPAPSNMSVMDINYNPTLRPVPGGGGRPAPSNMFSMPAAQGDIFQQAAQNLQMAGQGTMAYGAGPNIAQFQNPYTQQVIRRTERDIARQREMAMNQLGAQATAARAFGGSRQGVAEGVLGGEYARMAGDIAAQQRQAGFDTALRAAQAQQGIGLQAAGQLGNLAQTGFGMGQDITRQQQEFGLRQQMLNQALIDAARNQFSGFANAPTAALSLPLQAVGAGNMGQQTQTQRYRPGLFDYLSLGAGIGGGIF